MKKESASCQVCWSFFTCQITESREQHLACNLSKTLSFPRTVHIFSSKPPFETKDGALLHYGDLSPAKGDDSHYA